MHDASLAARTPIAAPPDPSPPGGTTRARHADTHTDSDGTSQTDPHTSALRSLRQRLEDRGFFSPSRRILPVVVAWFLAWAAAWIALLVLPLSPLWVALAVFGAVAHLRMGFAGHDAGHYALDRRRWVNEAVGQITMSVICGLCFDWWRARHNKHHVQCQRVADDPFAQQEEGDPDMWFGVLFSVYPRSSAWYGPLARLWMPIQRYSFWPFAALYWVTLRLDALNDLFRQPKHTRIDRFFLPLHFALLIVLPGFAVGWGAALGTYVFVSAISTLMTASVFSVNHIAMRRVAIGQTTSYFEHQVTTSRNVANPAWADFYFGGLNFQIEHHLFPRVPMHRLRAMAPTVREACARNGLEYTAVPFRAALRAVMDHLTHMSNDFRAARLDARRRSAAAPAPAVQPLSSTE